MKILLADDEPEILRLYKELLQGNRHEVTTAQDGDEALERIDETAYDLLVLDLYMPKRDGFAVLAEMRRRGREVPVIVMTGHYPDDEIAKRMQGMSVEEVLRKPVMITTLLNAVNRMVTRSGEDEAT